MHSTAVFIWQCRALLRGQKNIMVLPKATSCMRAPSIHSPTSNHVVLCAPTTHSLNLWLVQYKERGDLARCPSNWSFKTGLDTSLVNTLILFRSGGARRAICDLLQVTVKAVVSHIYSMFYTHTKVLLKFEQHTMYHNLILRSPFPSVYHSPLSFFPCWKVTWDLQPFLPRCWHLSSSL